MIPVGVTCTVTESPVPDGWGLTSISPDDGVVTIVEDTSEVTVTNTRLAGSLVVQKVAAGDPIGTNPVFTIEVDCANGFSDEVTLDLSDDGAALRAGRPDPVRRDVHGDRAHHPGWVEPGRALNPPAW